MTDLNQSAFKLSLLILRKGIAPFRGFSGHEITKTLNRVAHCCLNYLAAFGVLIIACNVAASFMALDYYKAFLCIPDIILAFCMWLELAAVRNRSTIPMFISGFLQISTFAFYCYIFKVQAFLTTKDEEATPAVDPRIPAAVTLFTLVLYILRLITVYILYYIVNVKSPQFSTTVFLKPTNTPVTFSSILAPEVMDPTNPYRPSTTYNNKLNKSVC